MPAREGERQILARVPVIRAENQYGAELADGRWPVASS